MKPANDESMRTRRRRLIGVWLLAIAGMVFAMVVLGGLTRLTNSGLSMVEWRPVTGWLPPLTHAAWEEAFDAYRAYPEYHKLNAGMTLPQFQGIYWLEYLHRLWGRLIGVAFAVPFAFFLIRGWVDRRLAWKLAGLFLLGGLQGALGWYMVQSGLVDRPDVSQYRLVAHLGTALLIIGYAWLLGLSLLVHAPPGGHARGIAAAAAAVAALVLVTILAGGFVAGLDAGYAYNTFPLMDGELVPSLLFASEPAWRAPFEDVTTAQFVHRVLATMTVLAVLSLRMALRGAGGGTGLGAAGPGAGVRTIANLLCLCVLVQFALGVTTLLTFVALPVAALHQANAIILWMLALSCVWVLLPRQSAPRAAALRHTASPAPSGRIAA